MGGRRFDSVREVVLKMADGYPQFESASSAVVSRVYSLLAQLVEHLTVNQVVAGSSPAEGAKFREVAEWSKAAPC
jgi:hypothetical protein